MLWPTRVLRVGCWALREFKQWYIEILTTDITHEDRKNKHSAEKKHTCRSSPRWYGVTCPVITDERQKKDLALRSLKHTVLIVFA